MRRSLPVLVLCTLATVPSAAVGQDAPRPATVEDVLAFKSLESPVISPDGAWVAYVVSLRDMEENDYDADIWLVATDGGDPVRLTRGPGFDGDPAWSPDGSWIAFRSDRGEEDQVYGIRPGGGEAWPVTSVETGVSAFALSPDGSRIAWVATSPETEADEELEKERGQPIVADSAYATEWAHLWTAPLVDRVAGEAVLSSPDGQYVSDVVWAPDSRAIAWSARPSPRLSSYVDEAIYVLDEPGAEVRQVTTMPGGVGTVDWSDAGLLVWGTADRLGTSNERIWRVAPRGSTDPIALTDGLDEHAELVWAGPDALLVEASRGPYRGLVRVPLDDSGGGNPEWVYDGPLFAGSFSASKDGSRIAFVGESPTQPRDLYVADSADVRPRRLTDVNPQAGDLAWGETRTVTWRSRADGEEIEGILTLPVGYAEGQRVPLLLRIHGGPSGVSTMSFLGDDLAYPTQVFAGLGYAVLQPNYRGSTGYGERFRGLNRGDISGRDWIDVDSGVDHLIELGIADPERLGIMGWSFGGHHTYWGITQTDRYKAASAGAGANELVSMFHQTDLPDFYHTYLGPSPWEDWKLYEERSAYRRVERVTTPLLIQVGENDARVPKEQSRMFYEAMRDIGKAPVRMVTYPGQPHGIREPRLQRDVMARNVDWFRHWIPVEGRLTEGVEAMSLLGRPLYPPPLPPEAEALQRDSLAAARARLTADPGDAMARIWVGRRQAYLGRYNDAIATFTAGITEHPSDPRFYRHRGHRFITTRRFSEAVADLRRAAALIEGTADRVEPDGLPNAAGIPLSTLQFNIWYHLGLAQYLQGDLEGALTSYRRCMDVSSNPDLQVATAHWLYMTLRELGREAEAAAVLDPITSGMEIIENGSYHALLLMYKGERSPESLLGDGTATDSSNSAVIYGVGNWYAYNGEPARAREIFERLVTGDQWAAFGSIAAEAKLARR